MFRTIFKLSVHYNHNCVTPTENRENVKIILLLIYTRLFHQNKFIKIQNRVRHFEIQIEQESKKF